MTLRVIDYMMAALCAAALLVGCETAPDKTSTTNRSAVDALSPRTLEPGECGLFVWAGEARRFMLFSRAGAGATFARGGEEVALTAQAGPDEGDLYGQIPVQTFLDPDGKDYALSLSSPEVLDGGTRYASGTWRHKDDEGWDVLTPVYGLSTCRPVT